MKIYLIPDLSYSLLQEPYNRKRIFSNPKSTEYKNYRNYLLEELSVKFLLAYLKGLSRFRDNLDKGIYKLEITNRNKVF